MDLADDVAYSVHDVEDGVVAGRIDLDLARPRRRSGRRCATGTSPTPPTTASTTALAGCGRSASWPTASYDGSRRGLAALKNLTSDLIGRFCGGVQHATFAGAATARSRATPPTWSCPSRRRQEIAVLKGIAAHYVMQADDRVAIDGAPARAAGRAVRPLLADRGPDGARAAVRRRLATPPPTTPPGSGW